MTPYVNLLGTYDFGASSTVNNTSGQVDQNSTSGIMAMAGLQGYQSWERSRLGISLNSSYQHFVDKSVKDADNETLSLALENQLSRRVSLTLSETGTTTNRGISTSGFGLESSSLLPGLNSIDPNLGSLPTNELIDQRIYFSSTGAQLTYQKTARLSFFGGGGGFVLRRTLAGMPGENGASGLGGIEYALSRRQAISFEYKYIKYNYTNAFGGADTHEALAGYDVQINRRWRFKIQGGGLRIGMLRTISTTLDPSIAAILGQTYAIERYQGAVLTVVGNAGIVGSFRKSSISINYLRNTSAGNGIYLASRMDSANGTYSYYLRSRCTASLGGGYNRQTAFSQNYKPMEQVTGHMSFSYRLSQSFYLTGNLTARHIMNTTPLMTRPESLIAAFGIGYTPSRGLPIW